MPLSGSGGRKSPHGPRGARECAPLTVEQAQKELENGEPSIIRTAYLGMSDMELEVGCAMLKDDEVDVLVRRIGEVLAPRRS